MKKTTLLTLTFLLLLASCRKEKNRVCEIYESEHGYTIGKVESSVTVPTRVTYNYNYKIDGISYSGKLKEYGIGQDDLKIIGREYLVVYKLSAHNESHLNFNYRIESLETFYNLLEEFKSNPPEPHWPKCKN